MTHVQQQHVNMYMHMYMCVYMYRDGYDCISLVACYTSLLVWWV